MSADATLERLSELAGLITAYRDAWGRPQRVSEATQRALLAAMGISTESEEAIAQAVRDIEDAPWRRPLDPVHVAPHRRGAGLRVALTLPMTAESDAIEWHFEQERGRAYAGKARFGELPCLERRNLDGTMIERRALEIPMPTRPGYHRLRIAGSSVEEACGGSEGPGIPVIVFPQRSHFPRRKGVGRRAWSIGTQLYSLRSKQNWGVGDFTDLRQLLGVAARLGADAVGLNPLHALFPGNPERISPYSPSDRRFVSMLYIDVEAVPDFAECEPAKDLLGNAEMRRRLEAARATPFVDYPEVVALKLQALELVFGSFRLHHLDGERHGAASERGAAFRRFQRAGGSTLRHLGVFQALSEHFGPGRSWEQWPDAFHDCDSAEVASFAADHRDRVDFYHYLQWQAEGQLRAATQAARDAGMGIGLFHDLALAADRAGAETWMNRRFIAREVSLGAPPDEWNHHGQDWGLPAYNPHALRAAAYAPFAEILHANMGHGGALRIDHVMALERTYWIPRGADPRDGGYVRSPVADLIGVLALESVRHKCVVIGEDLGTLPEGFSARINAARILSYRVLYFTRDAHGGFLAPRRFPSSALVAISTHDLATFRGFWSGRDLDVRAELGLYVSKETETAARERRAQERRSLIGAFKREGLLPASFPDEPGTFSFELLRAALRFLARTPAMLLTMHLIDALGEENQVNLPGTVEGYPNWRRKIRMNLEELEGDAQLRALAAAVCEERRERRQKRLPPVASSG